MATPDTKAAAPPSTQPRPPPKVKPPKLSKAEKKQLRLLARQALQKKLIRDQLIREMELTKKSAKRGKLQWEGMCKEIKVKEFREEIELWGEKTEILLTKKDQKIDLLLKTLDETQEIHGRNFSKHIEQLDYLNGCLETLRQSATAIYETQALELIYDFMCELSYIQDTNEIFSKNMEDVIHATNVVAKRNLRQNYELYMIRKFGEVSTEVEKRYILRDNAIIRMRNLQDQLLDFMKFQEMDIVDVHRTEKFNYFMQRQRNCVLEFNRVNNTEKRSLRTIAELQRDLLHIETEANKNIYGLKLEEAYFLEVKAILKNVIAKNKALTSKKVFELSSESYRVLQKLKEIVKHGELLINVGKCCRKFQTEKEKVYPLNPETDQIHGELSFKMNFDIIKHLDISEDDIAEQVEILKHFWRRCSNVRFHILMLMEERRKLNEENEKYRNIIRSMKKSDDVRYILESLEIKQLGMREE